jgi:hypothetical protein
LVENEREGVCVDYEDDIAHADADGEGDVEEKEKEEERDVARSGGRRQGERQRIDNEAEFEGQGDG